MIALVIVSSFELPLMTVKHSFQGRTLSKLILNICSRTIMPHMDMSSFYVMISRVRTSGGLRLLRRDESALDKVLDLEWPLELQAWEKGYDEHGKWNRRLAADALEAATSTRNSLAMTKATTSKLRTRQQSRKRPGGKSKAGGNEQPTLLMKRRKKIKSRFEPKVTSRYHHTQLRSLLRLDEHKFNADAHMRQVWWLKIKFLTLSSIDVIYITYLPGRPSRVARSFAILD